MNLQPTAKVSVKKSVLKKYEVKNEDVYFLKKDAEFEIELFNPLQETIKCDIMFNGKSHSIDSLVLYHGQRVFLERHLDTDRKLVFNSYMIDDSSETAYAVRNNGLVKIDFYLEREGTYIIYDNDYSYQSNGWNYGTATSGYVTTTDTTDITNNFLCHSTPTISGITLDCGSVMTNSSDGITITTNTEPIETGLISKGEKSNQAFVDATEEFRSTPFHTTKFRILPDSQKIKTIDDLKHKRYCTECGKRIKPKDKFCSACGNKLSINQRLYRFT